MEKYTFEGAVHEMPYGFISGTNGKLLLIKTGTNGSIHGYNNKYLKIADSFASLGYSVLCCGTPMQLRDPDSFRLAIALAEKALGDQFDSTEIFYMGVSKGAYQGVLWGDGVERIKELLLINPPLSFNFHKQTLALRKITKPHYLVFGTEDPSYQLHLLLKQIDRPLLKVFAIENADHHFSARTEIFETLPQKLFVERDFSVY